MHYKVQKIPALQQTVRHIREARHSFGALARPTHTHTHTHTHSLTHMCGPKKTPIGLPHTQ